MREAVVVSYARTGLAKSGRGGFNITPAMSMAAHAISTPSRSRASSRRPSRTSTSATAPTAPATSPACPACSPACRSPRPARRSSATARRASTPSPSPPTTSSTTAPTSSSPAASSRSPCPTRASAARPTWTRSSTEMYPAIFMAMIETADIVAERYGVSRESQDEYSLQSQQRMAAAQEQGLFADEIVPMATKMKLVDKETKEESIVDYVVDRDECNRPEHHARGPGEAEAGPRRGQLHHRRQRQPALRRRRRRGADGGRRGRAARPHAARRVQGLGRRRLRARRDGHRPGVRRAPPARAPRAHRRRHRPVGAQRGVRQPVPVLAATGSASTPRSTTSTAARSPSATRSA